jgi:hypothetical protein
MNTDIAAQKALDRLARVGFEKLTHSEKILAAVWTVEADFVADAFSCGDCPRCHRGNLQLVLVPQELFGDLVLPDL